MDRNLLLTMLVRARRPGTQAGLALLPGMLILLALATGSLALASFTLSDQLGASQRSSNREARVVAEAGLSEIIASFNQPQNRGLLVAGQPMGQWASSDATLLESLRSPCVRSDGSRPGGEGLPSADARALGDGNFRDLETGSVGTGARQYRLTRITYSAGNPGQPNRRANSVTTVAGQAGLSNVRGSFNRSQINLEDPDSTGPNLPGYNRGFISVTVEGRVSGEAGAPATASVTREFEVLPKCCGASFGSNGSGGAAVTTHSLGSDSRYCGVEFGIITGINGGEHFSYEANDRFTTRDRSTGQLRDIRSILGVLKSGETEFRRSNRRVAPHAGTDTTFDPNDPGRWDGIRAASPTAPCWTRFDWGVGNQCFGSQQDIDGLRASGIPIVPVEISLPPTNTTLNFAWTAGAGPSNRISTNTYPAITANGTKQILRTNNDPTNPRVEICSTSLTGTCSSWTTVSTSPGAGQPWCEYSTTSPVTNAPGFHCLGPKINLTNGATLILDTSGGPLSLYYNQPGDNRGTSRTDPLIGFSGGSRIQHVRCATVSDSCSQPISDSSFSSVGEPDRLNFFGRQNGPLQFVILGILPDNATPTSPGKLAGAWLYFPRGFLRLNTYGCGVASSAADQEAFWRESENWIFSGRIWTSHFYPCGNVHIRVPPSSEANLVPTLQNTNAISFVNWQGVDWVARSVTGARNY